MRGTLPVWGVVLTFIGLTQTAAVADTNAPAASKPVSPIAHFRTLLAMTEGERTAELANRPEAQRTALALKVEQYAAMPAAERELRLRATELRYYLLPMMRLPAAQREARLQSVPEELRDLVEDRLVQWNMIPPGFQEQLIENQAALLLFSRMHPESPANADDLMAQVPAARVAAMEEDFNRWQTLSPEEQSRLLRGFNHFFELTPAEKERTLRTLSAAERSAMARTLQTFENLPPSHRAACIQGFQQFVLLPPDEQAKFLKNADRWEAMPPEDREEWRTVVEQLSQMPPLPPGVEPVLVRDTPPLPPGFFLPVTAGTN
jgi:hypothetical protein